MRVETIGAARLLPPVGAMFRDMAGSRLKGEIVERVVKWVAVDVVDNVPTRNRPIGSGPYEVRAGHPLVGIGHFDKCPPIFMAGELANNHGAHWQLPVGFSARLKLTRGRKMNALHAGVPRRVAGHKAVYRTLASAELVPVHPCSGEFRQSFLGVPDAAADLRTEARLKRTVRLDGKRLAADFTLLVDHDCNLHEFGPQHNGCGTTDIACRRIEAAQRQADLFVRRPDAPKAVQEALL